MRLIGLFFFMALTSQVLSREILYKDGNPNNSFAYPANSQYCDLNMWQKIAYMLAKNDVVIRSYEGDYPPRDGRELLYVDYRGHFPSIKEMQQYPKHSKMNILFEPPTVFTSSYDRHCYKLFSKIFTFHDGLVDGTHFIKFRYPVWQSMRRDLVPFHERKFACAFFGNKKSKYPGELYSERCRMIKFFEKHHPEMFDFYGPGWEKEGFSTYRGIREDKCGTMKQYKFSFPYENTRDVPGYITEKIFDAFQSGVVPVYLGSPTVAEEIPDNCFIDMRKFPSYHALYEYLVSMSEQEFNQYLENIRGFLDTEQAKLFDVDHFVLSIVNGILDAQLTIDDLR